MRNPRRHTTSHPRTENQHSSFLKRPGRPNIPIQAIGLSLYESLPVEVHPDALPTTSTSAHIIDPSKTGDIKSNPANPADPDIETPGTKVTRTQWLDLSSLSMSSLIGKNILIVDEVDDTRTTLEYAVRELEKDVEAMRRAIVAVGSETAGEGRGQKTTFSIFVLHNKAKVKKGHLPVEMMREGRYLAARETGDVWICYPWEATDIEEHDRLAGSQGMV